MMSCGEPQVQRQGEQHWLLVVIEWGQQGLGYVSVSVGIETVGEFYAAVTQIKKCVENYPGSMTF